MTLPTDNSCDHRYIIKGDPFRGYYLICRLCDRFYGKIKDSGDLDFYRRIMAQMGEIDLNAINWR